MTRTSVLWAAVTLLAGCNQQEPVFTDEQMDRIRAESPDLTDRCLEIMRWHGIEALQGDCTKRDQPKRWRGLWRNDFEGSLFCPAPALQCRNDESGERIWLDLNPMPASLRHVRPGALYAVEFVGRRSSNGTGMSAYGYRQDIVVDRLISIKQVEAPPPEPTAEEELAYWKACLANHTCMPNATGKARIKELEEATKK
jgi:hypothetical protein